MLPQQDMSESIMRRVYVVYFFRRLMYPVIAEMVIIAGAIAVSTISVSFGDVIANAQQVSSMSAFLNYIVGAVLHTEIGMQLSLLVGAGVSVFFIWKISRTISTVRGTLGEARFAQQ
ncbi:MAG TPA: hypothetical protein VJH94_01605 [Candidatus Paceibacterota bacterium]